MTETNWTAPVKGGSGRTIRTINADPGIISDPGARHYAPRPFGNAGIFSTAADREELSRLLGGCYLGTIGYRDWRSAEIWNRFVPWPKSEEK